MPLFIESVRAELRVKHYSLQTEKSYLVWIRRFIRFHDLKHPKIFSTLKLNNSSAT
ncbi:phage integrase N-terminal SAM-like domain-containing protein [Alteromonas sp. a30]|uniref:phage integrase N-terminal SAM-like domain-containing protein n=1 Tax=Alteromonas sp. a30 TaxID=2730917 RepID=UPI00227FB243|nr:phage integrase N-terminal SAM-like domain-containing protein [Alteromonas sp. a30]